MVEDLGLSSKALCGIRHNPCPLLSPAISSGCEFATQDAVVRIGDEHNMRIKKFALGFLSGAFSKQPASPRISTTAAGATFEIAFRAFDSDYQRWPAILRESMRSNAHPTRLS